MANTQAPNGFNYLGSNGTPPNVELSYRKIASGNATKIYRGDPVKQLSTGYIAQWTAGTSAAQLVGIFHGCKYLSVSLGRVVWSPYWPGSDAASDVTAEIYATVSGPPLKFLVQSSGTAITLADIGANIDVAIGTGNTRTGVSGASVDQATINTTATLPFKIVELYQGIDNGSDATSSFNKIVVQANTTATAGI